MFCPKCGIENPDNGKFCRSCGANLSNVLAVVIGDFSGGDTLSVENCPIELRSTGIRNTILGAGFFVIGMLVFTIPGNTYFWILFLFPALALIASGASRLIKADALKQERAARVNTIQPPTFAETQPKKELPPTQTDYVKPQKSIYKTEDLVGEPLSVTENTTRHLEMQSESETMTLPKN